MAEKAALAAEMHKLARRQYRRRRVEMYDIDDTWQADLIDMQNHSWGNKGNRYILMIIDNLSKFAWAVPTKTKTGKDITEAMRKILKKGRVCKHLHVDQGSEFYNKIFQKLLKKHKISIYSTFSGHKASIIERLNRTIKNKMWEMFSLRGNHKWIDILPDLIEEYNNSNHRTIGMKPIDVTSDDKDEILLRMSRGKNNRPNKKRPKFKVGDKVRISKVKHIFEKGYTPNWTGEIFTIKEAFSTIPYTYKLQDYRGEVLEGRFYEEEILKTDYPTTYLVEKVLRRKGSKSYIKWLGFDSTQNSWESNSDLL